MTYSSQAVFVILAYEKRFLQGNALLIMAVKGLNSVDPDQLASLKPDDLDLHCFQNRIYIHIKHIKDCRVQ